MTTRVVVFIDYQNVYRCACDHFGWNGHHHTKGQVLPGKLARLLCMQQPPGAGPGRQLQEVRVYRGIPSNTKDPRGYAACRRQLAAWQTSGVTTVTRTLRYPRDWPRTREMEKGIDVSLAIDFVMMAVRKQSDVGILMSTDTDLLPALETVRDLPEVTAETAGWHGNEPHAARVLSVKGGGVFKHTLSSTSYLTVEDPTDYNR